MHGINQYDTRAESTNMYMNRINQQETFEELTNNKDVWN